MDEHMDRRIIAVLLKGIYKQNLISEDTYHHCLDNIEKVQHYTPERTSQQAVKSQ